MQGSDQQGWLLEREEELGTLASLLSRSPAGEVAIIRGPAGIGKSRLLEEGASLASEAGIEVLRAQGSVLEAGEPFGVAVQLLAEPPAAVGAERERLLTGPAAGAAPLLAEGALDRGAADPDRLARLHHGLSRLALGLAECRPILVAVDDAQWSDLPSLRWLVHLGVRLGGRPLLIVIAARAGERPEAWELIELLSAQTEATVIAPATLGERGTGKLLRRALGEEPSTAMVAECLETTRGNPLLVEEIGYEVRERRTRAATPPETPTALSAGRIEDWVTARLGRQPGGAIDLARAVGVLGEATLGLAAELAGLDRALVIELADALREADLLAPDTRLEFRHPVIANAIYQATPTGERARLHLRAADLVRRRGADATQVANHLLEAEDTQERWATESLLEAGSRALTLAAPEAACRYLEVALRLNPPPDLEPEILGNLGAAEVRIFDPQAIEHLEQAAASERGSKRLRKLSLVELGRAHIGAGRLRQATRAFEKALVLDGDDPESAYDLRAELLAAQLTLGDSGPAMEELRLERERLRGETAGERKLLALAGFAAAQAGEPATVAGRALSPALADARMVEDERVASTVVFEGLLAAIMIDRRDLATPALERALHRAVDGGWALGLAMASALRAFMRLRAGEVGGAITDARHALEAEAPDAASPIRPMASGVLAEALLEAAQPEEAERVLSEAGGLGELPEAGIFHALLWGRARLRIATGEREAGVADLLETGRRQTALGGTSPATYPWRSFAAVELARSGEVAEAKRLAEEELELARALGTDRAVGIALRGQGIVRGGEEGIKALEEGVELLEGAGAKLEQARALVDLGALQRRQGSRRQAREPLREARALAESIGASAEAERASEELRASGAKTRRTALTGPASLTPSELRVVRQAAFGRSNREISEALFVSVRTVEAHLSSAYSKLGIGSRSELALAMAPEGGRS